MKEIKINVCKDFSTDPWGRHISDNPLIIGQAYREELRLKAIT